MAKHKGPDKANRKDLTLIQIADMFPTDAAAEEWFIARRWPQGPYCPHCGSVNVQCGIMHKTMTHRCRDCPDRRMFSLKTGSIMEGTKLGYRKWAIAYYLVATNLKAVSSMKLHRDLGISQKAAWHLSHRIREALNAGAAVRFVGPAEADETHIGGKRKNMPKAKRKELTGRGAVGKATVAGVRDRETGHIQAAKVDGTDAKTLKRFVRERVEPGATLYTDEAAAYRGMPEFEHEAVNHSVGEYVRDMAHTNGIESFWAMLKRDYQGTFHHFSEKHLDRYVGEFATRHNIRPLDIIDMMGRMVDSGSGKRLRWRDLIADNG